MLMFRIVRVKTRQGLAIGSRFLSGAGALVLVLGLASGCIVQSAAPFAEPPVVEVAP